MNDEPEILFEKRGSIGRILMNRPKALNALTLNMCELMHPRMKAWATDSAVKAVVIRGAGEKAFCAGGDVVRLYEDGRAGRPYPYDFWRTEYRLNTYIKRYPKPYVALIDGISMGGGVGVSEHGSHRVVTDRTTLAMPETGIGLFPDVGGTYFLPRLPGAVGTYLGLTGRRLKGPDCVALGLADAFVKHDRIEGLEADLAAKATGDADAISRIIESHAEQVAPPPIVAERDAMDKHFSKNTIEQIVESLASDGGEWAKAQLATLKGKSPLSMKITLRQIRTGANLSFEEDNAPKWEPATIEGVTAAMVDAFFAPLPPNEELDLSNIA
jgi:enoyl-CoA hydratase